MEEQTACLEITTRAIKLLVGHEENGYPVVIYRREIPNSFVALEGEITNSDGLADALKTLSHIEDPSLRLRLALSGVFLVLPSASLQVLSTFTSSVIVEKEGHVTNQDVANVMYQLRRNALTGDHDIIDIIPTRFDLERDNGVRDSFVNPPLGEIGRSLSVQALIFTIPHSIAHSYQAAVERAGFSINGKGTAAYFEAQLCKLDKKLPKNYFLVDIGANLLTVGFIGSGLPYCGLSSPFASASLTRKISADFGIDLPEAEQIKARYGRFRRDTKYDPPISSRGQKQKDLNREAEAWEAELKHYLDAAIEAASKSVNGDSNHLPLVFVGGGSKLLGLSELLRRDYPGRELYFPSLASIGSAPAGDEALLGALSLSGHYRGTLSEQTQSTISVDREQARDAAPKKAAKKWRVTREKDPDEDQL